MIEKDFIQKFRIEIAGKILLELVKKLPMVARKDSDRLTEQAIEMTDMLISKSEQKRDIEAKQQDTSDKVDDDKELKHQLLMYLLDAMYHFGNACKIGEEMCKTYESLGEKYDKFGNDFIGYLNH